MTNTASKIAQMEIEGQIDYTRQRDWFDPKEKEIILNIIGCGGIGSMTAILAAKLGIPKIRIFDMDNVEPHNIPNQNFDLEDVGLTKVKALANRLRKISPVEVIEEPELFNGQIVSGLVVSGVDSMNSRELIHNNFKSQLESGTLSVEKYWDARLGGEYLQFYSLDYNNKEEVETYEKTLYNDAEALELPCTRRAVIDVMGFIASFLVNDIRKHLAGDTESRCMFFDAATLELDASSMTLVKNLHDSIENIEQNEATGAEV